MSFETEKSVRVVTLKMKNNQLKVVSKSHQKIEKINKTNRKLKSFEW